MPYNTDLEKRIDRLIDNLGAFDKKKMFGGIGYMLKGKMPFGIHKQSLVIRTSPERAKELHKNDSVSVFDMTGRPMAGWLLVSPAGVESDQQLLEYLNLGIEFIKTLP